MQTPHVPEFRLISVLKRAAAGLLACGMLLSAAACAGVRVSGVAESAQTSSPCELAYYAASDHTATMNGETEPKIMSMQYVAALQAQHEWLDVAIQCSQRFTEGTVRSAQAQFMARTMATKLGQSYQPLTVNMLEGIDSMAITDDALANMALAEDRAGFSTEVLAGIYAEKSPTSGNANVKALANSSATKLVAISNNHKEAGSEMMSIATAGTTDLRRKIYATDDLTGSPYLITDPAVGIQANTVAVVEINAARAELEAMADNAYDASKLTGDESSGVSGALASSSDSSESADSAAALRQDLLQLSMLIGTHAYTAFMLGYPNLDAFLFTSQS